MAPVVGPRHVEVDIERDLPPVAGDAAFVDQCLANLVENVARHTPETATPGSGPIALDDGGPLGVEIEVEDDGPGVRRRGRAAPVRALLSGAASARPGTSGMGIGLAIVRGLTEAMGGTVVAARGSAGGLLDPPAPARDAAAAE